MGTAEEQEENNHIRYTNKSTLHSSDDHLTVSRTGNSGVRVSGMQAAMRLGRALQRLLVLPVVRTQPPLGLEIQFNSIFAVI